MSDDALRDLLDHQQITAVLNRYASSIDDRDWARLRTCFTTDAVGDYVPGAPPYEGIEAIETLCRTMLGPLDASQHLLGNYEIDLHGETAKSRCYVRAQHVKEGCEGGRLLEVAGYYRDDLVRSPDGWRIQRRQMTVTWREGNPRVLQPESN
jgi:3-phenylpropionate/cinnamic acid dioxygenase small subunit